MARQKDTFYFDGFRRSADYACQAAKLLSEVMHDFNPGQLRERMDSMHAIEKSADEVRHDMMDELVTAFITPFDREDIDELGHVLDDVTDSIEGVLNRMYYDNVTDMRDDAVQMSDMVVRATESSASWSTNCRDSGIPRRCANWCSPSTRSKRTPTTCSSSRCARCTPPAPIRCRCSPGMTSTVTSNSAPTTASAWPTPSTVSS